MDSYCVYVLLVSCLLFSFQFQTVNNPLCDSQAVNSLSVEVLSTSSYK